MRMRSAVFTVALLVAAHSAAYACSCMGRPAVCGSYLAADAVFTGSVQSVKNKMSTEDGEVYISGQTAQVQVEKVFKGAVGSTAVFRSFGSSCDATYEQGQRWLFYAYLDKKSGMWSIRACDRSRLIEGAAADMLYLQGLPASAQKTRIAGEIAHYEQDPARGFTRVGGVMGARVRIKGEGKSYEVYTDSTGAYEIYGLPPGSYDIEPEVPAGLMIFFSSRQGEQPMTRGGGSKLLLGEKGCAGMDFVLGSDTSISGRLFGADGRVMPGVCLHLLPKEEESAAAATGGTILSCTDKEGRYKLERIPPGEYVIVANEDGKISSNEPFPTAYYPGVFEREKAAAVTVTTSAHLEGYDINIPSQEARRTVRGVLVYADGRPAVDASVNFEAEGVKEGYEGTVHTKTDDKGRFTMEVLQGLKGRVSGDKSYYSMQYESCPVLKKLVEASGGYSTHTESKPVRVEAGADTLEIKLVLPYPYCPPAKEN